jgi:hypothetical protein
LPDIAITPDCDVRGAATVPENDALVPFSGPVSVPPVAGRFFTHPEVVHLYSTLFVVS